MRTDQNKKTIWEKQINEFNLSNLSAKKWCAKEKLTEGQFWYWKAKLKKTENNKTEKATKNWIEVKTEIELETKVQKTSPISITIGTAKVEVESDFDIAVFENIISTLVKLC